MEPQSERSLIFSTGRLCNATNTTIFLLSFKGTIFLTVFVAVGKDYVCRIPQLYKKVSQTVFQHFLKPLIFQQLISLIRARNTLNLLTFAIKTTICFSFHLQAAVKTHCENVFRSNEWRVFQLSTLVLNPKICVTKRFLLLTMNLVMYELIYKGRAQHRLLSCSDLYVILQWSWTVAPIEGK